MALLSMQTLANHVVARSTARQLQVAAAAAAAAVTAVGAAAEMVVLLALVLALVLVLVLALVLAPVLMLVLVLVKAAWPPPTAHCCPHSNWHRASPSTWLLIGHHCSAPAALRALEEAISPRTTSAVLV